MSYDEKKQKELLERVRFCQKTKVWFKTWPMMPKKLPINMSYDAVKTKSMIRTCSIMPKKQILSSLNNPYKKTTYPFSESKPVLESPRPSICEN